VKELKRQYKKSKINGETYLYPIPVIKNSKYLIYIEKEYVAFFIDSWKNGFLTHPDENPSYLKGVMLHSDDRTPIMKIMYGNLHFEFLQGEEEKKMSISKVLSLKINSFLNKESDAKSKLIQTFNNQLKCKTCQKLGVGSDEVLSWISHLIQYKF